MPGKAGEAGEEVAREVEVGEVGMGQPCISLDRIGEVAVADTQFTEIG